MKYMIHTYPKREWYVNEFLIPSMLEQGIKEEDIIVWNDDKGYGNLKSWAKSCEYVKNNLDLYDGCWHLQDDVLLCHDFKERTSNPPMHDIVAGYIGTADDIEKHLVYGKQLIDHLPYTFPCIWIPNRFCSGFYDWYVSRVETGNYMPYFYKQNKFDDLFFMRYMSKYHKYTFTYNLEDSLVEHIYYLMGGDKVTPNQFNIARSFKDQYLVEELKKKLEARV